MCGIAGVSDPLGTMGDSLGEIASNMASSLRHRGPDDAGVWVERPIALAHRRLSIIDLSELGHQPMESADGRYITVFNGEIYNFEALRHELIETGEQFRSRSDTEVLLVAVSRWGLERALQRANGMFALALYDKKTRTLFLARDRIGQKPLYYGMAGSCFAFASELKALKAIPGFCPEVDRASLCAYLFHGYVPAPQCIYEGFWKLPPGAFVAIPIGDPASLRSLSKPRPYWSLNATALKGQAGPLDISAAEAEEQLDTLLRDAVRHCMVSDVPLGAFLSGGIDSSTVVSLMQAESSNPVRTFTIGFEEKGYNEAVHAAAVARQIGTDHTELYIDDTQARKVVPDLADIYDEPFSDSSQIPTLLVSRLARASVSVSLSGDGGDELFGGYNRYVWGQNVDRWRKMAPYFVRAMAAWAIKSVPLKLWDGLWDGPHLPRRLRMPQAGDKLYKLAAILDAPNRAEIYRRIVSVWENAEAVVSTGSLAETLLNTPERWPPLDFSKQMMLLDAMTYLPDDILVKVDRASMSAGLEARLPLLDHRVVEFAWRLPCRFRLRGTQGKWLLRRVLARYVPPTLTDRPKMGFGVPIDSWLRKPLRAWAESLLDRDKLENDGFFDASLVRQCWLEHLSGSRNWQHALWCILMFQAWKERWIG